MKKFFNLVMAFAATMILASGCNKEPMNEPVQDDPNTFKVTATTLIGTHMQLSTSNTYMVMLADEGQVHNYLVSLYNQLGEIDDNGNVTIPAGTYTCTGGTEDFAISTHAAYADASEGAGNTKTVMLTDPIVEVSENQIVLTVDIEGITHIVTYNGTPSMPADLPEEDVDFEANYAYAYYTASTDKEDVASFKLFLSDLGHDAEGNILPNGVYYRLTLHVDKLDANAEVAIPAGRYEIGETGAATGYITDGVYYVFGDTVAETTDTDIIKTGYLTVNEDGSIEASLKMYFSKATHTVTFSGEVEICENTIPTEAPYSTLTSDKVCDLSNHSLTGYKTGEVYGNGYEALIISIGSDTTVGDNIMFEILCDLDKSTDISGRYTISNSKDENTATPGYVDGFTLMGSWYYYQASSLNISEFAPLVDGWVEIQIHDEYSYTVKFDVYDDLNNHITGTYTNVVQG